MAVTLGGYPSQSSEGVRNQMREWLLEGVSLMAVDEKSGKVMGMRGAYVVERWNAI